MRQKHPEHAPKEHYKLSLAMKELRDAAELLHRGCVSKGIHVDVQFKSTEHEKKEKSRITKKSKQKPSAKLLFESLSGLDCNV